MGCPKDKSIYHNEPPSPSFIQRLLRQAKTGIFIFKLNSNIIFDAQEFKQDRVQCWGPIHMWEWAYAHIVGIWPTSFVNVVVSNNFIFFISVEMLRPAVLLQRNLWWVRVSSWWTALLWKPWAPEWAKSKEFSSRATKIDWLKKCKAKTGLEAQNHAGSFGELCIHGFLSLYDICQTERHSTDSLEWLLKLLNCSMLDWLWDFKLEMIGMLT